MTAIAALILTFSVGWVAGRVSGFREGRLAGRAEILRDLASHRKVLR